MSAPFRQEEDVLPGRIIVTVLLTVVVVSVLLSLWAWRVISAREAKYRPSGQFSEKELGAPHRVQQVRQGLFELEHDADRLAARKQSRLSSYGWVDRTNGLVREMSEGGMTR